MTNKLLKPQTNKYKQKSINKHNAREIFFDLELKSNLSENFPVKWKYICVLYTSNLIWRNSNLSSLIPILGTIQKWKIKTKINILLHHSKFDFC